MNDQLTILVADDHALIREAWSFMLNHDRRFRVIAETGNGKEVIDLAQEHQPNIVLLDIQLEEMSGIESIPFIRRYSPGSKILGVSMHTQAFFVRKMLQAGAAGYLTKNSKSDEMFKAIIEVHEGRRYICDDIRNIHGEVADRGTEEMKGVNSLSKREMEVIGQVMNGYSSKEIAGILNITTKTIEVHRYNIMKKLKLKNVATLVNYFNRVQLELEERSLM